VRFVTSHRGLKFFFHDDGDERYTGVIGSQGDRRIVLGNSQTPLRVSPHTMARDKYMNWNRDDMSISMAEFELSFGVYKDNEEYASW